MFSARRDRHGAARLRDFRSRVWRRSRRGRISSICRVAARAGRASRWISPAPASCKALDGPRRQAADGRAPRRRQEREWARRRATCKPDLMGAARGSLADGRLPLPTRSSAMRVATMISAPATRRRRRRCSQRRSSIRWRSDPATRGGTGGRGAGRFGRRRVRRLQTARSISEAAEIHPCGGRRDHAALIRRACS